MFYCSYVICMKMIQSLISSNAAWVEMVQGQPQAHTGGYDNISLCYVRTGSWKVNEMNVYMDVFGNSNLFRVFGTTPGSEEASTLEANRSPNRFWIHIYLGVFISYFHKECTEVVTYLWLMTIGDLYKLYLLALEEGCRIWVAGVVGEVYWIFTISSAVVSLCYLSMLKFTFFAYRKW